MNKLVLAVFISTLFTNKAWSDEIHPAMPAPANKVAPVAAPVKKHWWQFFKKPKATTKPVTTSQGFSTKIVAWGGQFGNGSFGQYGSNNYQPSSYGNNYPTCNYQPAGSATTYPSLYNGGPSTTTYSNGGSAITYPSLYRGGPTTTYYSRY
jgi:hypothetical protein